MAGSDIPISVPTNLFLQLPQFNNNGCAILNIQPTDHGQPNPVPVDFNPRPGSSPGVPTSGTWVP